MKKLFLFLFLTCNFIVLGQSPKKISIIGVGDIMMGTNYPSGINALPPNDGKDLFSKVTPFFKKGDIVFGNFEGVFLDSGGTAKSCQNPDICYVFRTPDRYVDNLVNAGFNLMNLANNHSNDFGEAGLKNTQNVLSKAGIYYAGILNSCEYVIFKKDSITYGFCGFAPNMVTVKINNYEKVKSLVKMLKEQCDIVIVSFHGGAEGASATRVTRKTEMFHGENRGNVYEFAHLCIDNGADVVFGHGPHVPRAIELYNDRFIAYSLGNFCTPYRVNLKGTNGYAPMIKVNVDEKGRFINGKIKSAIQLDRTGPQLDPEKRALKEIKRLTELDFPDGKLSIDANGVITRE